MNMGTKNWFGFGMATVSLALLAGCSDSTSPVNEFYNQIPDSIPSMEIPGDLASSGSIATNPNGIATSSNSVESTANSSGNIPTSSPNIPTSSPNIPASSAGITSQSSNSITSPTSSSSALTPASSSSDNVAQVIDKPSTDRPVITYGSSGATVANGGACVTIKGGTVKITCGGEYVFCGSYSGNDAQILVASPKTDTTVYLNMKGLTLTNTADAPIYVQKSNKTFVVAKNGTTNTFTDAATRIKTYSYTNDA
ncbi:MAG: carbohydrate-binding domain-containing protein, partial [Fibrobacter sp.]|nr:carbohydrate-binding domain-containing protein [Fibrobacter sp.]